MTEYFEQQGGTLQRARPRRNPEFGDTGIEGPYYGGPPITSAKWPFEPQPWQPPAFRFALRIAALLPGDLTDSTHIGPLLVPFREGWAVQSVQPPAPARSGRQASAALAKGDEGIQEIFVAPWAIAPRAKTFPTFQNDPKAAIPTWNAGPQIGAVNTLPNINSPTVLKAGPGTLLALTVITAGSGAGGFYDCATNNPVAPPAAGSNQIWGIPNTVGIYVLDWPCQQGILVVPGSGQVLAAKWV